MRRNVVMLLSMAALALIAPQFAAAAPVADGATIKATADTLSPLESTTYYGYRGHGGYGYGGYGHPGHGYGGYGYRSYGYGGGYGYRGGYGY